MTNPACLPFCLTELVARKANGGSSTLAIAIAVPIAGCAVLVAALVGLIFLRRSRHRTILGKVMPPGCTPDTTLLCTDIQVGGHNLLPDV